VRDYSVGMRRVEDALQAAGATTPATRRGSFNATLCLAHPDGRESIFVGKVEGTLVWPPRGDKGFGFDPVFMPDGFDITFGEMPSSSKHSWAPGQTGLSHRARAFAMFVEGALGGGLEH
jgi:XTP/dITP diphosphohydrolase